MSLRVIEIVASVANPSHGPSYSAPRLAQAVRRAGGEVQLFTVGKAGTTTIEGVVHRTFAHDLSFLPRIGHLRLSGAMNRALREEARGGVHVLHTHGLWLSPNIAPAAIARAAGRAFVVSPRGMLGAEAMQFSSFQKKVVWSLAQRRALAAAAFIHATSEEECAEVRAMGLSNPVVVLPNWIDVPPPVSRPERAERIALSLGRIHPKKGLNRLIGGWAVAGEATRGWRLRIVGPDEGGHAAELQALAASLALTNVDILGPAYGEDKAAAYREASLFVLSTLNENFGIAAAEALAAGVPVISTRGAPWAGLETEGCGWWIDHGEEAMAAALRKALALPHDRLRTMGEAGRAWMLRDFSWDHIGRRMLAAYDWAVRGGEAPPEVRL
jgi:glycosyltransferase involved in cell wall biosynthesis